MARTIMTVLAKTSLEFLVLSLFVRHVSSQSCTGPYPQTCICSMDVFSCIGANLTEFPSDLPNGGTLLTIDLSSNLITEFDSDVLSNYTQLETLNLSRNPVACDSSLAWLTTVTSVLGTCASGQEISAFLESLKPTPAVAANDATQQNPSTDAQTQPTTDAQSQAMTDAQSQAMTDAQSQPMSTAAMRNTTQQPEPNRLYVLAIIIPILVIVVIIIAIVVFSVKRNRKQQEAYNSSIRYSVVRKDAGAPSNRVYSDVTTEL